MTRKRRSGDMPYTRRTDPGLGKRGGTCSASPRNCGTRVTWCWLACRVLLKIVYVLTCRALSLAVLAFRGDLAKDAELLVLRH